MLNVFGAMRKWQNDLDDVKAIYADVLRFAQMPFEEWKAHVEEHPEDRLHHINLPEGGHLVIGAETSRRFAALTTRQIAIDPKSADLDRKTLNEEIRALFVKIFLEENRGIDRPAVDRMLARAVRNVKRKHRAITHYLPCTLVGDHDPREFRLGPVRFLHESKFFEYFAGDVERDHSATSARHRAKAVT